MSDNQKKYTVNIHDKAAQMLYDHIRFVANVSILAARKLKTTLYQAIYSLEKMPFFFEVRHFQLKLINSD